MSRPSPDLTGEQVTSDDALSLAVGDDEVEHLGSVVHRHRSGVDLGLQGLGTGNLELLTSLTTGVVGARDLHAAEGSGGQLTAVLAGERSADGIHVVDDLYRLGAESNDIGLTASVVASLDGVLDEPLEGVAVNLAGPSGVDTALSGHRVGPTRRVVEAEGVDVVAELPQGRGDAGTGQSSSHHDDVHLASVGGVDQLVLALTTGPRGQRVPLGGLAVKLVPYEVSGLLLSRPKVVAGLGTLAGCSSRHAHLSLTWLRLLGLDKFLGRLVDSHLTVTSGNLLKRLDDGTNDVFHEITPARMSMGSAPLHTTMASAMSRPITVQTARRRRPVPPKSLMVLRTPWQMCNPMMIMTTV